MTYAYARVSSREQNTRRQLDAFARRGGVDQVVEEHGSGRDFENRAEYQRLVARLRRGDTLVVTSLDRFGRNYDEIIDEWRRLTKTIGVTVEVLDMPLLNVRPDQGLVGQFVADVVLQILSFVAQHEREAIHERQRQGIAAARARGVRFGRPRVRKPILFDDWYAAFARGETTVREGARTLGLSRSTLHRMVRGMNHVVA